MNFELPGMRQRTAGQNLHARQVYPNAEYQSLSQHSRTLGSLGRRAGRCIRPAGSWTAHPCRTGSGNICSLCRLPFQNKAPKIFNCRIFPINQKTVYDYYLFILFSLCIDLI